MVNETHPYYIMASFSPDGLHWTEGPNNPILKHNAIEPTGLIKHGGRYLLNGQGGNVGTKRALVTFVSYDFDHWSDAVALGFRRDQEPHRLLAGCHAGEQVHLGAGLWDRGNVVLGVYGMWHGESNDRRFVSMDLGLLVSNDGLHFSEPIPDFRFIPGYEIDRSDDFAFPCLEQGQGFANVGDESLIWYANWRGGDLNVARFPRDRMGYFEVVPDPRPNLAAERGHPPALLARAHRRHGAGVWGAPLHLLPHRPAGSHGSDQHERTGRLAPQPAAGHAAGRANAADTRVHGGGLCPACENEGLSACRYAGAAGSWWKDSRLRSCCASTGTPNARRTSFCTRRTSPSERSEPHS